MSIKVLDEMKYQAELDKAQNFVSEGKHLKAAKIFEEIGTKSLREGGDAEKKAAPKIIAKSIARYMLAGNISKAQDLAFQVIFMKESDPFLSLQIEAAISTKKELIRAFIVKKIPKEITEEYEALTQIPQNRKVLKITSEVTIKNMWEWTNFGTIEKKYDLIDQKYSSPKEMFNFILATKTGVNLVGAEAVSGEKLLVLFAVTFNQDPVEVIGPK